MDDQLESDRSSPAGAAFGLRFAALAAAAAHTIAGLAMLALLRPGLATAPFEDRVRYLAESRLAWCGGWIAWTAAAITFLAFASAARRLIGSEVPAVAGTASAAVWVTVAAVGCDLSSQAIEALALPWVASAILAGDQERSELFLTLDRVAVIGSGGVANALYTVAALMIAWLLRTRVQVWTRVAAAAIGFSGIVLSASALLGSVPGMVWSHVVLLPAIVLWLFGIAGAATVRRPSSPIGKGR